MKYVDEFRDPRFCAELTNRIRAKATRRWVIMEVCGGQTHSLLRHGIDEELEPAVELIHGPGCPVCVTPPFAIDAAIELAARPETILVSFGDMLRVPGTIESLSQARARGGDVRIVYSPIDALRIAQENSKREVVFLAVGFETTAATTALAAKQAQAMNLANFSMLVAHVRVLPAMEALAASPNSRVQAYLAAGHVCTVDGYAHYADLVDKRKLPIVVAGFEPADLLLALMHCVEQLESGKAALVNCYQRSACSSGNVHARRLIDDVYEPVDSHWRGIGLIPLGGLSLRDHYSILDARRRFTINPLSILHDADCRSGDVLTGRLKPTACPEFGKRCKPAHPLGAPMVSSEGACAAYFQYANHRHPYLAP